MKSFKMKWLPFFLLTTIGLLFLSCEAKGPEAGVANLKMQNQDHGGTHLDFYYENTRPGYLYISNDNNFNSYTYGSDDVSIRLCDVGKKKIGSVKTVPSSGWVRELAVISGHTYVAKITPKTDVIAEIMQEFYYKIYVVNYIYSTSGGIIGAEVRYCEWDPQQ